ncbi:glutamine amidotransferase [Methylobacillus gramineus]|uniref:glutamine amidotransferase n=1 Tax=Methylobacillus gramineus TaxID=755169 RepID=UPI001CFFCC54|nr:glutamine amidotransferase [Methylobacillus gramineus]MCB5184216.1 glutamine amidotransferase [Methylobacillus gramineus]
MKTAMALRHLAFEDLDGIAPILLEAGYTLQYVDTPTATNEDYEQATNVDLLFVLGGPIGVYQTEDYPFLQQVIDVTRHRLESGKATLGICLGAQIMARALGANVYAGVQGKEIGWSALSLNDAGKASPLKVLDSQSQVLHWHGDTFDLPDGATLLASSALYANQAFAYGRHGLALQFHIEVTAPGLERWYVGHVGELGTLSVPHLRAQGQQLAPALQSKLKAVITQWIANVE